MASEWLKKYYAKLRNEGILKAFLCALIVGFAALFVSATIFLFVQWKEVWVCAIVFGAATLLATPVFYFTKFRPNKKMIAKRVDELGLEERLLTMTELEGDNSYIAIKQREDAMKALQTVNAGLIKYAVSASLIIAVAVSAIVGIIPPTIATIAAVLPEQEETKIEYTLTYKVQDANMGKIVTWDNEQSTANKDVNGKEIGFVSLKVFEGEDAEQGVTAVANEGYMFLAWSDGYVGPQGEITPYRIDTSVEGNATIWAIFAEADGGLDEEDTEEDSGPNLPWSENGEPNPDAPPIPDDGNGDGSGGRSEANNQVVDGETFYGGELDGAIGDAAEAVSGDGSIGGVAIGIIGGYYGSIGTN
ncbi:MAG: hypothetical protein IJX98_00900 [Clostridia bacterium]|nr:hypothetical protein [Clostridia bacterium]